MCSPPLSAHPRPLVGSLLFAFFWLLGAGCASAPQPKLITPPDTKHLAPPTLITNVRVFTGLEDELSQPVDVLLAGGRVARIANAGTLEVPDEIERVDGTGRTLLPGFIDMNVRLGTVGGDVVPWADAITDPHHQLEALLYSGITTAVVVGHDVNVESLQKAITQGKIAGPRLYRSTYTIARDREPEPGPFGRFLRSSNVRVARSPRDAARAARRDLEYLRSDFVRVEFGGSNGLDQEQLEAVVAEARMYEREAFASAAAPADAALAAEGGAALLLHPPWKAKATEEEVDAISIFGTPVTTTARIWAAMGERMGDEQKKSELEEDILEHKGVSSGEEDTGAAVSSNTRELAATYDQNLRSNLRSLQEVGVPLLAGTGAGLPGVVHGASYHQELEALVALGFPPAEVLKMATSYPVRLLAPQAAFGVVGRGAYADLVLVEGDPLEDMAAVGKIVAVWQAGRKLERLPPEPSQRKNAREGQESEEGARD